MKKILIIPDTHAPYHDKRAWKLMVKAAKGMRPDIVVILGDFVDCYTVSSHSKDPVRKRLLKSEVASANALLDELDALGAKEKIFIEGNHEDRLRRYICDKAPELFGLVNTVDLLKLKKRGWSFVPYKSDIRIGKVSYAHDVDRAGRDAVFAALALYQSNIVTAHTHRMAYVVSGNVRGKAHASATFGWLGDVSKIDYKQRARAKADYVLGFGQGFLLKSGITHLTPVPIVEYACVVEGKYYSV